MLYYKIHWDVYIFISAKAFLKLHLCSLCGSIVLPHSWIKDLSLQNNRNIPKIIRYLCQSFNISKQSIHTYFTTTTYFSRHCVRLRLLL